MDQILTFSIEEATPAKDAVLENQGIPPGQIVSERIDGLFDDACELLARVAVPTGIQTDISTSEFAALYEGDGRNEPRTPVGEIFVHADRLALFAVTLGAEVSSEIGRRFSSNDLALASMLDSAASVAADNLAEALERRHIAALTAESRNDSALGVLRYSPGYCGWHVSGQRRLFASLHPERIGITLGESFLMQPLKSVSGVLIAGPKRIHHFRDSYPFCDQCEARGCRERLRALFAE
jgi:hypothetical protein